MFAAFLLSPAWGPGAGAFPKFAAAFVCFDCERGRRGQKNGQKNKQPGIKNLNTSSKERLIKIET